MSASSKKKLRNAQEAEMLTEKQLAEQKEAKKLKVFSAVMILVLAVMVVFAAYTAISNGLAGSGMMLRNTTAVTVGDHEVSAMEYNCFYIDSVYNFYSQYGSYASLVGLDVTKPLDQQYHNEEEGITWADYFKTNAEANIKSVYAIVDEANANGFTLSEEQHKEIESQISSMTLSALYAGFSNLGDYVSALYGTGTKESDIRDYMELCYTATAYQQSVSDGLTYTAEDLKAEDAENGKVYSNYTFNSYYMSTSKFLEGGTVGEDGTTTYSDEEQAAAALAAEEAAKSLVTEEITSVEALDAAIKALPVNAEATSAASTVYDDYSYDYIPTALQEWVSSSDRQAGDLTYIPATTTDEDGHESISGYYVVFYTATNDNTVNLQNVRHILSAFKGGTKDENGNTTYSDDEKAAAKATAEALYTQWKDGDATEDTFATLANEKSDDGDGTTGGLFEDVYPGQMVTAFNDWCFDAARQAGDTEIVETEYGYHIMY